MDNVIVYMFWCVSMYCFYKAIKETVSKETVSE
jgi:hypothetical protein